MSLIKWNPEVSFFPTITNWMDDFFPDNGFKMVKGISIPAVNIKESKTAFTLEVAAPGFKKDDFKLEIKNGYLVISGETKEEKEEKDESYTRKEYSYNSFNRSFSLPDDINAEKIGAQYLDGVLKVTVPKKKVEEKPAKQIAVK